MKKTLSIIFLISVVYFPYTLAVPYATKTNKLALKKHSLIHKRAQIQSRNTKYPLNHNFNSKQKLTLYNLDTDCNNSIDCFVENIPKQSNQINDRYTRIGDIFSYLEKNSHSFIKKQVNRILTEKDFNNKLMTTYLNKMGWVSYDEDLVPYLNAPEKAKHNYKLAKEILLDMSHLYKSPQPNEIVIYIRASDKVNTKNDGTCKKLAKKGCQEVINNYANYILTEVKETVTVYPDTNLFTIVSSNFNYHTLDEDDKNKQHKLYSEIIEGLSKYSKTIQLHSSSDLDEDLYYMVASKHFISMREIGNLSDLALKIHQA